MKNLFSQRPTEAIIEKALHVLGFDGLQDSRQVTEDALVTHMLDEFKDELRAFYYPVFYKEYVLREHFHYKHLITVVRQLLRTANRSLHRKEKCKRVDKNIYHYTSVYRLSLPQQLSGTVSFESSSSGSETS